MSEVFVEYLLEKSSFTGRNGRQIFIRAYFVINYIYIFLYIFSYSNFSWENTLRWHFTTYIYISRSYLLIPKSLERNSIFVTERLMLLIKTYSRFSDNIVSFQTTKLPLLLAVGFESNNSEQADQVHNEK